MGNNSSKPSARGLSISSNTPLVTGVSTPVTPTPLLTSFSKTTDTASTSSPIPPVTPTTPCPAFTFPSRENNANGITVTSFSGETPPASRPPSCWNPSVIQDAAVLDEDSGISRPTPARPNLRRLSELIDPVELANDDEKTIRSPSGNMLGRRSFEERYDRVLSIRERQERIMQQVMLQTSQAGMNEGSVAPDPEKVQGNAAKKKRGCCACLGA
ncbi:hypothetical protein BDV97DRAFT_401301 [Delphinella strobiligena]|nr:hypothetical protein BDV97DRAFT_401301 [Delphinella strobiligena]